jgi:hypothetical protein
MKTLLISKKVFNKLISTTFVKKVNVTQSIFFPPPSMSIHVHGTTGYNKLLLVKLL